MKLMHKSLITLAMLLTIAISVNAQAWRCGEPVDGILTASIGAKCWMIANIGYHATGNGSYYTWDQAETICQQFGSGWSLPSEADLTYLGDTKPANWNSQLGGYVDAPNSDVDRGLGGYWWSTTSGSALLLTSEGGLSTNTYPASKGLSVRCVHNVDIILDPGSIGGSSSEITTTQSISFYNSKRASIDGTSETLTYSWVVNGDIRSHDSINYSLSNLSIGNHTVYRRVSSPYLGPEDSNPVTFSVIATWDTEDASEGTYEHIGKETSYFYTHPQAVTRCIEKGMRLPTSSEVTQLVNKGYTTSGDVITFNNQNIKLKAWGLLPIGSSAVGEKGTRMAYWTSLPGVFFNWYPGRDETMIPWGVIKDTYAFSVRCVK